MFFYTRSESCVAFGVEQVGNYFNAEFVFFTDGLSDKITAIFNTGEKVKLIVPKEIKNSMLPGKTQNVTFFKVED